MRISDWSSDVCSSDLAFVLTFSPGRERIFILPLQHAVQPHRGLGEHVICKLRGAGGSDEPCLHADGIKSIKNGLPDGAIGGAIIGLLHRFGAIFHKERSEEHTSELQSLMRISYAVFCLKKKTKPHTQNNNKQ